jgi:hypothetical protein
LHSETRSPDSIVRVDQLQSGTVIEDIAKMHGRVPQILPRIQISEQLRQQTFTICFWIEDDILQGHVRVPGNLENRYSDSPDPERK